MISKKKISKRIIKRINPSNLKWKLNDYIRTHKITSDKFEKDILNEIQSEIDIDFSSNEKINALNDKVMTKSYHYKQLQNIIANHQG